MANEIELFEQYIDDTLSTAEKKAFDERLASDKEFATSFRVYLFSLHGISREAEETDMEFGMAMKNISEQDLRRIIKGTSAHSPIVAHASPIRARKIITSANANAPHSAHRNNFMRERVGWISAIAAVIVIGLFTVIRVQRNASYAIDDMIVEYNYYPDMARGGDNDTQYSDLTNLSHDQLRDALPALQKAYRDAPVDDTQEVQVSGMRLAMAYLMLHDRKQALYTLKELKSRFADDADFSAQCEAIIQRIE